MPIHLVLADDWELRGDGSGSVRDLQLRPLDTLRIYEDHGVRGTFNAEVMQQLYHRRSADTHPDLASAAAEWEDGMRDVHRRGHDAQLHLHPQWIDARYGGGIWHLDAPWGLDEHSAETLESLVSEGIDYFTSLLLPINPEYRCVAFRGGAWSFAPHPHLMDILSRHGIVFDMSIVQGVRTEQALRVDYRFVEEPHYPYFPCKDDARRLGDGPGLLKNMANSRMIERFVRLLARAHDIEVVTAARLAENICAGTYPIAAAGGVSPREAKA